MIREANQIILNKVCFGKSQNSEAQNRKYWKRRGPNKKQDPSNISLKILTMGATSIQKHELEMLNMRSIYFKQHGMKCWY